MVNPDRGRALVWLNWNVHVWDVAPEIFLLLPYPSVSQIWWTDIKEYGFEGTPSDLPVWEVVFSACLWCPQA